jgi:ELWxxDGT repeat protein
MPRGPVSRRAHKTRQFVQIDSLEPRRLLAAVLAADINRLPGNDYKPFSISTFGNTAYFAAHDGVNGMELWKTDGTAGGTSMVKDINPGMASSQPGGFAQTANGTVYFTATTEALGYELWKTDGTAVGTVLVKDINPGRAISVPQNLTAIGNKVYFSAVDGARGREYWVSDGTEAGTQLLVDLRPGSTGQNTNHTPLGMTAVGSTLFFGGNDGVRSGLWTSNGAVGNVTFVASVPQQVNRLYTFDNRAYFTDRAGQIWTSDGTSATTSGLPISANGGVSEVVVAGNALFYLSPSGIGRGVYRVPAGGTSATLVTGFSDPSDIGNVGGDLYVSAYDPGAGTELFRVPAGSTAGTLVHDVTPGASGAGFTPANLTGVGDAIYFTVGNATSGYTLHLTRGTSASTVSLKTITAPGRTAPYLFTAVNGRLLFVPDDPATGQEFWASNGTAAGTTLLRDIYPGTGNADPFPFATLNGRLLMSAGDGAKGWELWGYDRAGGASLVADINPGSGGSSPRGITPIGNRAVFSAQTPAAGEELWVTDGTAGGTQLVKDIYPGTSWSGPRGFFAYGGRAFFVATDATYGEEVFVTDGTAAGTSMLKEITPGWGYSDFATPVVMNGLLYFTATDAQGLALWRSDGTTAGTQRVRAVAAGGLAVYNGALYFVGSDASAGAELWRTDGTDAGTARVADVRPGPTGSAVGGLTVAGPYLYFVADDGATGSELWRSDGTAVGTTRLTDVSPGAAGSGLSVLTSMNDRLYFFARNAAGGQDLWQSAGTPAMTTLVKTVAPAGAQTARRAVVANGRLFFTADDGGSGMEMWSSDGTAAGTGIIQELHPGTYSSVSDWFIAHDGEVYAPGNDSVSGFELWRYADTWAPVVTRHGFATTTGPTAVTATLNEDATVDLSRLVLANRSTGQPVPGTAFAVTYDAATRTLRVRLSSAAGTHLADGDYRLTLPAGSVVDRAGNATPADVTVDFFVLAGDANRDRTVNFSDLLTLAKNYNQAGKAWADGDFTGDGLVNFSDLLILAKAYNKSLAAAPAPVIAPAVLASATAKTTSVLRDEATTKPVFSTTRVATPAPPKYTPAKPKVTGRPKPR